MQKMTDEALQARRAYYRRYKAQLSDDQRAKKLAYARLWRKKNRDRVKQYNIAYWQRRAIGDTLKSKVLRLKSQGHTLRQIGQMLNVSHMTVSRLLKKVTYL